MIAALLACADPDAGPGARPPVEVACPPAEPGGVEPGDPAADVALLTCAGQDVALHDLCGAPALVASWYGWCPSCSTNAALARELADAHPDLQVVVALNEDPLGEPVDGALCDTYVATYPSAAEVWMDPTGGLERYGTTDLIVILDSEGTVTFRRETATEDAIRQAVDDVLRR